MATGILERMSKKGNAHPFQVGRDVFVVTDRRTHALDRGRVIRVEPKHVTTRLWTGKEVRCHHSLVR